MLELAAVEHEPGPARAELADAGGLELLLEGVEGAERRVDRVGELAVGLAAAVGAHRLPEQRVVGVAAAVVAERRPACRRAATTRLRDDLLDRLAVELGALQRGVGLVHVGLVVLVVVQPHRLLVDVRLERVVVVGKRRDLVGHRGSPRGRGRLRQPVQSAAAARGQLRAGRRAVGSRRMREPALPAHRAPAAGRRRGALAQADGPRRASSARSAPGCGRWLPAGWRVHQNVVQIVREEMDAIGGQEMLMPVLHAGRAVAAQRAATSIDRALQAAGPPRRRARAGA